MKPGNHDTGRSAQPHAGPDGAPSDLWVFGYGSLMWRPGFTYREAHPAVLRGWRRSLCVYSYHHRGTPERPGLVLGLDSGGACRGVAFRVDAEQASAVHAYLVAREQVTMIYREVVGAVRLDDGRTVPALTFAVDRRHVQYAGALDVGRQVDLVRAGVGVSGCNVDYVANTLRHLAVIGVRDRTLSAIGQALGLDWRTRPAAGPPAEF